MARSITCRVCGVVFTIPDPRERRRGRFPAWCSPSCKRLGKQLWMTANRWRYRPRTLLDLMEGGGQKSAKASGSRPVKLSRGQFFPAGEISGPAMAAGTDVTGCRSENASHSSGLGARVRVNTAVVAHGDDLFFKGGER